MVRASRIGHRLLPLSLLLLAGCARLVGGEAGVVLEAAEHGPARSELGRITPPPLRERLPEADLWRPADRPPRAALVLAPGFSEAGRDDPRLLPLAESLARAGFAVRVPDLPGARRLTLDPADILALRAAIRAEAATGRRTAVAAISFAAAPALLAARAEPGAALVATLGGPHSLEAVAAGTRSPFVAPAFLLAVAEAMPDQADRWLLREAGRRLIGQPGAALEDLARDMTAQGRAALALAAERDPAAIPARIAALPAPARDALRALDPSRADLAGLTACLLAVHGEEDAVIPPSESVALARAVPRARLVLVPGFGHVEPAAVPPAGQMALIRAMRALLDFRDGHDPCAAGL